ncbi:MAG: hypothetical protein AABZ02_04145 [Bacteroidota bacterium]
MSEDPYLAWVVPESATVIATDTFFDALFVVSAERSGGHKNNLSRKVEEIEHRSTAPEHWLSGKDESGRREKRLSMSTLMLDREQRHEIKEQQ